MVFSCCFAPTVSGVPEGPPETWSKADVKQWFKHEGLQYTAATAVDGKTLVETSPAQWQSTLGPKSSVLVKAVNGLKVKHGALMQPSSPAPAQVPQLRDNTVAAPEEQYELELTDRLTCESDVNYASALRLGGQESAGKEPFGDHPSGEDITDVDTGPDMGALRKVWEAFSSFGFPETQPGMDSSRMMKLARECGLLDNKCTSVDVDLFFIKAKPVKRRISFEQFLDVIAACADKKGVETRDLLHIILNKGGPESSGAKAQSVRLYDDKSLYTGVAKQGGPTTVEEPHDLATILDRGSRRSTGNKHPSAGKPPINPNSQLSASINLSKSQVMSVRRSTISSGGSGSFSGEGLDLESMFSAFASFGAGKQGSNEMDRSRFVKLCKECGLTDSISADIVFSKHLKRGSQKISFQEFKACLEQIARDKHTELSHLENTIITSGGPMINTTCV